MNKYELLGPEEIDVPAHKELNGFSSTASTRKMALGGRKMAVQKVTRREIEKEQGLHGGAPEDNSVRVRWKDTYRLFNLFENEERAVYIPPPPKCPLSDSETHIAT